MNGFKSEGEKGKVKLEPRVEIWVSMYGRARARLVRWRLFGVQR